MSLDFNRPEVLEPPSYPPRCCVQQTITVTEAVTAKTAQRHDYPSKVRIPDDFVHPFRSIPYTDSGVFVHP
jgi:hypothetical protein